MHVRNRRLAAAVAVALVGGLLAPTASYAAPKGPKPGKRSTIEATHAQLGAPNAEQVRRALDWPADLPLTITDGQYPNETDLVRESGGSWIAEKSSVWGWTIDATAGDTAPAARPGYVSLHVQHSRALRDQALARLQTRSPESVAALVKAGPTALVEAECGATSEATPPTPAEQRACSETLAQLFKKGFEKRWPKLKKRWPKHTRTLRLPSDKRIKKAGISSKRVQKVTGSKHALETRYDLVDVWPWRAYFRFVRKGSGESGRTFARVETWRAGHRQAARTELNYRFKRYRHRSVDQGANRFTWVNRKHAETFRRVGTGVIAVSCPVRKSQRRAAIKCSQRLAKIQAKKLRPVFGKR